MKRKIGSSGVELIKSFEGCRLTAYKPVPTEIYYTIGYGHYGSDVKPGMTITQEQAEQMLISDLSRYEVYVNNPDFVPFTDQLNQNQFDALVSFCYNCGPGNLTELCQGITIDQVPIYLPLYNKGGGVVLPGLVRRRQAEVALYMKRGVIKVDEWAFKFIEEVMGAYYEDMKGNEEIQDATHKAMNALRRATGREEQ